MCCRIEKSARIVIDNTGMIIRYSNKVLDKMKQNDVFRFIVLAVVAVIFVGVVIIPPINYLLGGPEVAQFYPYIDLIWGLLD